LESPFSLGGLLEAFADSNGFPNEPREPLKASGFLVLQISY